MESHDDQCRCGNISPEQRAVIEAAKAWNAYNGYSPDEYSRLVSSLHKAVDVLDKKR